MKHIRVTMPDGSEWDVPAQIVAEDRAKYYEKYGEDYADELRYTLGNNHELIDWAANNMNWSEVCHVAKRHSEPDPVDFQEGWVNGDKEIVTYE